MDSRRNFPLFPLFSARLSIVLSHALFHTPVSSVRRGSRRSGKNIRRFRVMARVNPRPTGDEVFYLSPAIRITHARLCKSISCPVPRNEDDFEEFSGRIAAIISEDGAGPFAPRGDDVRQSESIESEGPRGASNYTGRHGRAERSGSRHSRRLPLLVPPSTSRSFFSIFLLVRVTDRLI